MPETNIDEVIALEVAEMSAGIKTYFEELYQEAERLPEEP